METWRTPLEIGLIALEIALIALEIALIALIALEIALIALEIALIALEIALIALEIALVAALTVSRFSTPARKTAPPAPVGKQGRAWPIADRRQGWLSDDRPCGGTPGW